MDLNLLDNYDYVYDMKKNHGHTDITLAKLFGIARSTLQRRTSRHKISKLTTLLDIALLDDYDYVFDMKINHNHTNESLSTLFGVSEATVKRRVSKHKISTIGISKKLRKDKLDTAKPILYYSVNTITKSEELTNRLIRETSILDIYPDVMNSHRYHFLKNKMSEIPKCRGCLNNTSLNFEYHNKVFYKFCSHICNALDSKIDKEVDKLLTKDWLYKKRIVDNLSFEDIGVLAGVSFQVIIKRLEKFGIDSSRKTWIDNKTEEQLLQLNKSRTKTKWNSLYGVDTANKLDDIDYLYDEYITKKQSAAKIANSLNILPSSMVRVLKKHKLFDSNRQYFSTTSHEEIEMYNFIKEYFPSAINRYRIVYRSLELDVYIPELKLGFEYNGCFPHCEIRRPNKYHVNKLNYFNEKGIRMVQIWSDDWIFHKDKVQQMILSRLGVIKKSIHARKCHIKEISHQIYCEFLRKNHILGEDYCKYRYGLYNKDMLVSVMGFKTAKKDKFGFELTRFSTLDVHGSFSKLLSYFRKLHELSSIYSIADLEIADKNDNIYLSNGFTYHYDIKPDYKYYNSKIEKRQHKYNWRRVKFKKLGYDISDKKTTEHMLALTHKLYRCYDSGKIMYKLLPLVDTTQ